MKVKAPSTIKKRISILEGYRKNCAKNHTQAIEENNEAAQKFYSSQQQLFNLRITELRWVLNQIK